MQSNTITTQHNSKEQCMNRNARLDRAVIAAQIIKPNKQMNETINTTIICKSKNDKDTIYIILVQTDCWHRRVQQRIA